MLGDSLRRRRGPDRPRAGKAAEPRRQTRGSDGGGWRSWQVWTIAALVVAFGSFGVGYLLSTQILFPRPDTAGTGVVTPSLYGERREAAESALREAGLEVGDVIELASSGTERGRVLAQDPIPGQQLRPGAAVSFAVSAGRPELAVPPLTGMREETARHLLEELGFDVAVQRTEAGRAEEGLVVGSRPEAGVGQTLPAVVTLLVSTGPPAAPDTMSGPGAPPSPPAAQPGARP